MKISLHGHCEARFGILEYNIPTTWGVDLWESHN